MNSKDKTLITTYLVIAAAALLGTWSQNIAFVRETGGFSGFVPAMYANHAAASISIDILLFMLAAFVFMWVEAKHLGIRFYWLYVVLALTIAISVAFPIFMAVRQRRIAGTRASR